MFSCLCRKSKSWNLPNQAFQAKNVTVPANHYGINGDAVTSVPKIALNNKTEEIRSVPPAENKTNYARGTQNETSPTLLVTNEDDNNGKNTDKVKTLESSEGINELSVGVDNSLHENLETPVANKNDATENTKTSIEQHIIKTNDNETRIAKTNSEHVEKEIITKISVAPTVYNSEHVEKQTIVETSAVSTILVDETHSAEPNIEHVKMDVAKFHESEPSTDKVEEIMIKNIKTNVGNGRDSKKVVTTTEIVKGDDELDGSQNKKRRSGLAGHAANVEKRDIKTMEIIKHVKEESNEILIREALANNEFLNNLLEGKRLQAVVDAMYIREVTAKEVLIHEGEIGRQLYISATGTYEISIKDKVIATFDDNRVFGELAILYNAKRQASIRALEPGHVWILDQNAYQQLMLRSEIERHDELLNFLRNVPKLNTVSNLALGRVTDLLKREFFATGSVIVRQGDIGDKFYIISAGSVTISKDGEGEVGNMIRGEFFGQLSLLNDVVRQATVTADAPGVECLSLSRIEFIQHFGSVEDIQTFPDDSKRKSSSSSSSIENPYQDVELKDLKIIDTLGVGGFGRVELVQHKQHKELTFALKYLKKIDMIQQQQQEHVYNEKLIQILCENIFIVRMYKTMRDNKYLYFLMESCLGGDLWSLLQKQKTHRFEESAARFYAASVLEALAYLHERNIVYRDLKPENLLLDAKGQLKLTDFGFAKKLGPRGKTYTFAGTPEYVAPEIVLNRGHDRAIDYWTLGVFIFELLVGRTPFRSNDTSYMKTYNLIIRGIESVRFPDTVPRKAENLIKKLCRSMATERLGCKREGAQAVRDHKWFMGLDWVRLQAGQLNAPFKRHLNSAIDTQYFDKYQKDTDIPPDELSGWDSNF